ncbi:MAG: Efflux transporter periplasmic adaptor subunit [Cyanobacteriota bacterium erpe_2018_sw_21hr_WHONDRS-SW48-000092_B_bin.40]|nr:Efflux transporter periplasmic adaptor subunit [Cyanobacteriota bacterium erpe_2018_sw_21hr_WHONDRS-SW48-000092_B_bin.40]
MQILPKSITPCRYRIILPISALALTSGLALTGCGHTSEKVEGKALAPSPASKVSAGGLNLVTLTPETEVALNLGCEKVSMKDVDFAVRSTGEVQANSNLTTKVSTPVSGRIIAVLVNIGDHVKEGQTLASIRSQDIEQTEADLLQNASQVRADLKRELLQIDSDINQNRAQLGLSQSTYTRVKGLLDEKIASKADFESAKTQYDKDRITIDALNSKRQATISLSSERLTLMTEPLKQKLHLLGVSEKQIAEVFRTGQLNPVIPVVSPETGVVTERLVNTGELADPSKALFTIADFDSVWLKADVYEKDISKVKVGQPIELEVDSLPGQKFLGKLNYVADSINPETRTLTVRAEVLNPGCKLKPKMFARMKILVGKARVLTLPKLAVQDAEDCKVVYVPVGKGQYREQPIKLGGESGSLEEVIGGLKEGDPIVVKGSFELRSESLKQSD